MHSAEESFEDDPENTPLEVHGQDDIQDPSLLMSGSRRNNLENSLKISHRMEELHRQNVWLNSRIRSFEEQIKEGEDMNRALFKDNEHLKSTKKSLESQASSMEAELAELRNTVAESNSSYRLLKQQYDRTKSELDSAQSNFGALRLDREFYRVEFEKNSNNIGLLSTELQNIKELLKESEADAAYYKHECEKKDKIFHQEKEEYNQNIQILREKIAEMCSAGAAAEGENLAAALPQDDILKLHHHRPLIGQGEGGIDCAACTACDHLRSCLEEKESDITDLRSRLESLQVEKTIVISQRDAVIEQLESHIIELQATEGSERPVSPDEESGHTRGNDSDPANGGLAVQEDSFACVPTTMCHSIVSELLDTACLVCAIIDNKREDLRIVDRSTQTSSAVMSNCTDSLFAQNNSLLGLLRDMREGICSIQTSVCSLTSIMESATNSSAELEENCAGAAGPTSTLNELSSDFAASNVISSFSTHYSEPCSSMASPSLTFLSPGISDAPFQTRRRSEESSLGECLTTCPTRRHSACSSVTIPRGTKASQSRSIGRQRASGPEVGVAFDPARESSFESTHVERDNQRPNGRVKRGQSPGSSSLGDCSPSSADANTDTCAALLDKRVQEIGGMFERRLNNFTATVTAQVDRIISDVDHIDAKYTDLLQSSQGTDTRSIAASSLRYKAIKEPSCLKLSSLVTRLVCLVVLVIVIWVFYCDSLDETFPGRAFNIASWPTTRRNCLKPF